MLNLKLIYCKIKLNYYYRLSTWNWYIIHTRIWLGNFQTWYGIHINRILYGIYINWILGFNLGLIWTFNLDIYLYRLCVDFSIWFFLKYFVGLYILPWAYCTLEILHSPQVTCHSVLKFFIFYKKLAFQFVLHLLQVMCHSVLRLWYTAFCDIYIAILLW